jgi:hypothetical protein
MNFNPFGHHAHRKTAKNQKPVREIIERFPQNRNRKDVRHRSFSGLLDARTVVLATAK